MQKNIKVALIVLIFMVIFLGGIYMFLKCDSSLIFQIIEDAKPDKASFIIFNNSRYTYVYNSEYKLELLQDGKWVEIPYSTQYPLFTSEAIHIRPFSTAKILIDWSGYYGEIGEGKYRILKKLYKKEKDNKLGEQINMFAEFSVP